MADMTQSKQQFANQIESVSSQLLKLAEDMESLSASYGVHGFDKNQANVFTDEDFATSNVHLTATIVQDAMFAIGTVSNAISAGIKNSLRECLVGGLP